jgi:hypothetical protein
MDNPVKNPIMKEIIWVSATKWLRIMLMANESCPITKKRLLFFIAYV